MAEPRTPRWRNWSREQVCKPEEIVRPRTREGLVRAIIAARERGAPDQGRRLRPLVQPPRPDRRHAAADRALDRILDVDRASGPGQGRGRASSSAISTAGSHDTASPSRTSATSTSRRSPARSRPAPTAPASRFRNVSAQIEAIELIVRRRHACVELSAPPTPSGLRAARVGIGALGVDLRGDAAHRPRLQDRAGLDQPRPLAEALDAHRRASPTALDHFEFYVFPHTETALCRESKRTDEPAEPPTPGRHATPAR